MRERRETVHPLVCLMGSPRGASRSRNGKKGMSKNGVIPVWGFQSGSSRGRGRERGSDGGAVGDSERRQRGKVAKKRQKMRWIDGGAIIRVRVRVGIRVFGSGGAGKGGGS